ncbi:MAG: iron chelate uptake ABC transporter family permease subunit, partial [Fimbriimonas ginsengisoli]|nr:iron chelate uptake ABC transporter family permease subunit [Fimbriimonas ginsengisoli]
MGVGQPQVGGVGEHHLVASDVGKSHEPHLVRLLAGPDHRVVLPVSALLGGTLVLAADVVARMALGPAELPLGVVMAIL